jgi:hypothetical protein
VRYVFLHCSIVKSLNIHHQAAYDAQEAEKAAALQEKITAASGKDASLFVSNQLVLHSSSSSSATASSMSSALALSKPSVAGSSVNIGAGVGFGVSVKRKVDDGDDDDDLERSSTVSKLSQSVGERETLDTLKSTSYWLPSFTSKKRCLPHQNARRVRTLASHCD